MLAAEHYQDLLTDFAPPKRELLGVHHGKISLHNAKEGYDYPTIRLPHTLSKLAGLPTSVYQTVHDGALTFLVVIAPGEKAVNSSESPVLTWRRSPVRIRPSPFRSLFDFGCRLR